MIAIHVLEGLGTILLFLLPGAGLAVLLLGARVRGALRVACAYLLGLAWVAGGLYALSHVFSASIRRTTVLMLALPPTIAGIVLPSPLRSAPNNLPDNQLGACRL